ncbi:MAG: preprotein translocase subunit Sec61beta [Candidatus Hodarchaeota archaeon]
MSRRRRDEGTVPVAGAGLIRFFQEESRGIKIGPTAVVILSVMLMVGVLFATLRSAGIIPFP